MNLIKLISFDMEGTLITRDYSKLIWETDIPRLYGQKHGLDFETAKARVMAEYDTVKDDEPEWYNTDYWFTRLELSGDWTALLEARRRDCKTFHDSERVLMRLSEDYPLIISSNTIREFLEIQLTKLPDVFQHVYSAPSDFNTVKMSDEYYGRILEERGLEPWEVVHVGDSLRYDYEEAKKQGIHAFYLDRDAVNGGDHVVRNLLEFEDRIRDLNIVSE